MNVIKGRIFTGRVLDMLEAALSFVQDQMKEHTHLDQSGRFSTTPKYPEFVWKELIINAVAHRDYSIKGTDIQIKMFDDRIVVESPGSLPGIVRLNNMRQVHFSRNPKIASYLYEYEYVQEFGEGVDRIYKELQAAGLPEPKYRDVSFMLYATIRNGMKVADVANEAKNVANDVANVANNVANHDEIAPEEVELTGKELCIYQYIKENPEISMSRIAEKMHVSARTVQRYVLSLKGKGFIENVGKRTRTKWVILK